MEKIRVLVVDDSAVIRRVIREAFLSDGSFEVVGTASNGRIALAMIEQHRPDAITLDIEMPEMNGLQTLSAIRARNLQIPVIMFSTLTERGADATIEALTRGASDYVTKPSQTSGFADATELVRAQLIPKLKSLCGKSHVMAASFLDRAGAPAALAIRQQKRSRVDIVAIGTSTGGPNALAELLRAIPADLPVPILVVQHMPPLFTRFLADRLGKSSQIEVREGASGDIVTAGRALIAPGDFHMSVVRDGTCVHLVTDRQMPENSCRPAVDVLFRSVATVYGSSALGVVMTGMGQDGLLGSQHIRDKGGEIFVQDEASSVVWGMPGFVAKAGLANKVLPLREIGSAVVKRVRESRYD
jgi:two-component system chemotaxis response regulator CheB